jgi:cytochrome c1
LNEDFKYEETNYTSDWNIFEIFNKSALNPIAKLYINVSPPCGISSNKFIKRDHSLGKEF